jgi:hypothetical protein
MREIYGFRSADASFEGDMLEDENDEREDGTTRLW